MIIRGFFPKGRGEVEVMSTPIDGNLTSVDLTERGTVMKITARAFTAGAIPNRVGQMVSLGTWT